MSVQFSTLAPTDSSEIEGGKLFCGPNEDISSATETTVQFCSEPIDSSAVGEGEGI